MLANAIYILKNTRFSTSTFVIISEYSYLSANFEWSKVRIEPEIEIFFSAKIKVSLIKMEVIGDQI